MIQHIYADDSIRFDLADVQHIEQYKYGFLVIFKSTKWNFEKDFWENPANISEQNSVRFLAEWHNYKRAIQQKKEEK